MSPPMTEDQMPADAREFREKLRAFNLKVGEWLGLDPTKVFNFDVTEGREPEFGTTGLVGGRNTCVTWESTTKQEPRVGYVTHGARSDEDLGVVFTAELWIDWMDDRERVATTGPKPQMFTKAQEARLRNLTT